MADFVFTSPDGKKYRVTAPEGATEEQAFEMLQGQLGQQPQAATQPARRDYSTGKGMFIEGAKGAGRGLYSIQQAAEEYYPPAKLLSGLTKKVLDKIAPGTANYKEEVAQTLKADPQAAPYEQMIGTGAEIAGSMLPFIGAGGGGIAKKALDLAVPTVGGVVGEQLGGETGQFIGTLGSSVMQSAAGRMLNPKTSPELKTLVESGVRPTPGQATGGIINKFEELPLIREVTGSSRYRAIKQFNLATFNRALAPLGKKVDKIGFEGFAQADDIASQAYDDIIPNLNVKVDLPFVRDMARIKREIPVDSVREKLQGIFNNAVRPYMTIQQGAAKGTIDPFHFKSVDSELGLLARNYQKDPLAESRMIHSGLREIQAALRDMVVRQNPNYAQPLKDANKAWANLIRVENAVANSAKTDGVFTPIAFQEAVKSADTSIRHRAFASGKAVMEDWGRAGVKVLGSNPSPHIPYALLKNISLLPAAAGGAMVGGGVGIPLAVTAGGMFGVYNPLSQSVLANAIARRPEFLRQLGSAVSPGAPYGAIGTLPLFSQGEQ